VGDHFIQYDQVLGDAANLGVSDIQASGKGKDRKVVVSFSGGVVGVYVGP
jgi:hypothetical protein